MIFLRRNWSNTGWQCHLHFKEKLNELVVFRRGCSAANLWSLTLSRLSIIEGADILHKPHASDIGGGLDPSGPMKSAPLGLYHRQVKVICCCRRHQCSWRNHDVTNTSSMVTCRSSVHQHVTSTSHHSVPLRHTSPHTTLCLKTKPHWSSTL